jgi:selenocysteine lyase/cysteine desulfurase
MQFTRRAFLGAAAASAAAGAFERAGAREARASSPDDGTDWAAVRAEFAVSPRLAHFASFFLASHPRPVREAIARLRDAIDDNPFEVIEHGLFTRPEEVRAAAAAYLGGRAEDVALTRSTTEGLALVYSGLALRPGDEALTTTHDHYAHHEAMRLAARRAGARVRKVSLYDSSARADAAGMTARLRHAIRPATRVIGLTWVHSSTGVKLPLRALAAVVAEANARRPEPERMLLVVDGAHGFGVEDEAVADLGCDFFCAGTHKWILGPRGTGIVWARGSAWARVQPTVPSFEMEPFLAWQNGGEPGPTRAAWVSPGGFHAYEHLWALPAAFEFHARSGRARIAARLRELNGRIKEGLAALPHVRLHTPRDPEVSAALVCFEVRGMAAADAVRRLRERQIVASAAPYPVSYARLAGSLLNTTAEVDAAVAAVGTMAA